ncbi:MAG: carboxypeptidase-like regulatory domain-containing protein [Planctomycetota bacterium]
MRTLPLLLIVVVVLAGAWLLTSGGGDAVVSPAPSESAAAGADRAAPPLSDGARPQQAERRIATAEPPSAANTMAVIRGRTVDAVGGRPLVGCTVELHGWPADGARVRDYEREHGAVVWQDPAPTTTTADGTFALRFAPPPPHEFVLQIDAPGRVTQTCRWRTMAPGTVIDVGDVVMHAGTQLTGRVLDRHGAPQEGVRIALVEPDGPGAAQGTPRAAGPGTVSSLADGSISASSPLWAGTWQVRVFQRQKVAPDTLTVTPDQATVWLEVVVKADDEIEAVAGVVVDEQGAPIGGARVTYPQGQDGRGTDTFTGGDGSFRIERHDGDPDGPVALRVEADGHEAARGRAPHWGVNDVRLVMRGGHGLLVHVLAADGAPIEEFGVRLWPKPGTSAELRPGDQQVRARGNHPGGTVRIDGVRLGTHCVLVEPSGGGWVQDRVHEVEVTEQGAPPVEVRMAQPTTRTLHVVDAEGAPVVGSTAELLQPLGGQPVGVLTLAFEPGGRTSSVQADQAWRVAKGESDHRGEVQLTAHGEASLTLRLQGEGHAPVVLPDVVLANVPEPWELQVDRGAVVSGRIDATLLRQLLEDAGIDGAQVAPHLRSRWPGVRLLRQVDGVAQSVPADTMGLQPLETDGSFRLQGVPPGDWRLLLVSSLRIGSSNRRHEETIVAVDGLRTGERRALGDGLAASLVRGTLRGLVLLDEAPYQGEILLTGDHGEQPNGHPDQIKQGITSDADGRFELRARPGTFRVAIELGDGPRVELVADHEVEVRPGASVDPVFRVHSGPIDLRLLRADRSPVAAAPVQLARGDTLTWLAHTDADGRVSARIAPGHYTVLLVPQRLADSDARRAFRREHRGDPGAWRSVLIELGAVEVASGQRGTATVELPVPSNAGY